jgi:hypothetical protein
LGEVGGAELLSCQFYRHRRRDPAFAYGTGLHGLDALRYLGPSEGNCSDLRPLCILWA